MILRYLFIAILLIVAELLYFRVADKYNIIDKPNERSSHKGVILRGGGVAFLIGAWLYVAFFGWAYIWFMIGLTAIALISLADDIWSVSNRYRLFVHFTAMFMMFWQLGIISPDSWWIIIIALIVCVGIINAYNFMDGINGITGGYSLAVMLPLIYVNQQNQFVDANFLYVITLSILVFCWFNFRTKARCFAGDVGAVSMAFIVVFVIGLLILKTQDITYIMLLALYGVDSILTICHRIMLRENLGQAHRKHAYQLMANELHIPHINVSLFYMMLQLAISFGLVVLPVNHWVYSVVVLALLCLGYVCFMRRYYYLHREYLYKQNK